MTYILSASRTPLGSFLGPLSSVPATELGATAIRSALLKSGLNNEGVDEVIMGHVIQAGCGQAPARQAAIKAGLSDSINCMTINKVCGSGLQAIISASQSIKSGDASLIIAGGMENMSMAPHLLPDYRSGVKFGAGVMKDSMQWDGLWDVYSDRPMGNCAEECLLELKISRQEQDEFAKGSFLKSQRAQNEGIFRDEIVDVVIEGKKGSVIVSEDDGPKKANFEKMSSLRPAFDKNGSITAANASTINDGAAALVLGGEDYKSRAQFMIRAYAGHAQHPTWFTTAPVLAMKKCLEKARLKLEQIDLFEINEAFAMVTLAAIKEMKISQDRVNIYGGAVSLGHPIGCSGARIVCTLMNAMKKEKKQFGMASVCIGGGEALALIIEQV